jgi:hypothetical protein
MDTDSVLCVGLVFRFAFWLYALCRSVPHHKTCTRTLCFIVKFIITM